MSVVKEFLSKVAADGQLAKKYAQMGRAGDRAGIVKLAAELGFSLTEADLEEALGGELSLDALKRVTGGTVSPKVCLP